MCVLTFANFDFSTVYHGCCEILAPVDIYKDIYGHQVQIPGTRYLVPGTWYLVPGTRYLVPGTWYLVPGTRYKVPGTWHLGTWYQVPGTRLPDYQVPTYRSTSCCDRYQIPTYRSTSCCDRYQVPTYHSTSCCDRSPCVLFTDYPAVKRVCSQIPGTRCLVPGIRCMVPGTRYPGISSKPTGSQYLTKSMIYNRKIEVFKCQYAHFAHIRLSFGCTDEKMDFGLYLDTYGRISQILKFGKSTISV